MADTPLTDEYVASLLAKDAKDSSIRYSALGMEAFLPSKPPTNKPKPNTRFLRNIIKETDNHNSALLAKEAAESKARLATLETKKRPAPSDIRRRQLGLITAHLTGGSSKRRKDDEKNKPEKRSRPRNTSSEEEDEPAREGKHSRGRRESDHRERVNRSHRRHRTRSPERDLKRHRSRSRSRSRSPRERRSNETRHRHRSPHRSSKRERHDDADASTHGHGHRRHRRSLSPRESKSSNTKSKGKSKTSVLTTADSDSDPLDDIIGPRPPSVPTVRSRGRGLISSASGIDSRFSEGYDPQSDVALDFDEENDWEQALEALRDRQKWKAQGAERLRAAGFTDAQVEKWEKGDEKREEDVKWAKQGEGREWDRGKVVGEGGIFSGVIANDVVVSKGVDENWGRLKGT